VAGVAYVAEMPSDTVSQGLPRAAAERLVERIARELDPHGVLSA
jgi:hypothetical protein